MSLIGKTQLVNSTTPQDTEFGSTRFLWNQVLWQFRNDFLCLWITVFLFYGWNSILVGMLHDLSVSFYELIHAHLDIAVSELLDQRPSQVRMG